MIKIFIVLLLSQPSIAFEIIPKGRQENNEGVQLLEEEKPYEAYQNFVKALGENPYNPYIQMNLGFSFLRNEEKDKALKQMQTAVELSPPNSDAKFMSLFNLANLKAQNSDIDGALEAFQQALEIRPDSKEVKTNIELMWQQQQQKQQQQQQQKGQGQSEKKNEPQDGQQSQNEQPPEKKEEKPKPFDSKELSEEDVRKILQELKDQEQAIRADAYQKGAKDAAREKDW